MTDNKFHARLPLILILSGLVLLGGTVFYLFGQKTAHVDIAQNAGVDASIDADRAIAAAGLNPANRAAMEAVVRAYILEHPEIITEAVAILQQRETANRLAAIADDIKTPFPGAEAGNPSGDITIVEFSDYNCGFCRSSVADVQRLVANDKNIRIVFREVPILAPSSTDAALWALAAAKQGKHHAFHLAMFSGARPDANSIRAAAQKAGLDMVTAQKFITSDEARNEIANNVNMMREAGFDGTPTFVIGDQVLEGALGHDALKDAVNRARRSS